MSFLERLFRSKKTIKEKPIHKTIKEAERLLRLLYDNAQNLADYESDVRNIRPDTLFEESYRRQSNLELFRQFARSSEATARKSLLS